MVTYYDDNFGEWEDTDDPDVVEFYEQVQRESVEKECADCGRVVMLRPQYGICNSCAEKHENGLAY